MFAKGKTAKQFKKVLTKQDIRFLDVNYQTPIPQGYQDSNIGTFDQSRHLLYAHRLSLSSRKAVTTPVIVDSSGIVHFSKQSGIFSRAEHDFSEISFLNPIDLQIYNEDLLCECQIEIDSIDGKANYNEITPEFIESVFNKSVSQIDQEDCKKYFACKKHWIFDSTTPVTIKSFFDVLGTKGNNTIDFSIDSIDTVSSIDFTIARIGNLVTVDRFTVGQAVTPPIISSILKSPLRINTLDISQLSLQLYLNGDFDINKLIQGDFRRLFFTDQTKSKIENTNVIKYYKTHFKNPLEARLTYVDRIGSNSNEIRMQLQKLGAILTPTKKDAEYFVYNTAYCRKEDFIDCAYNNIFPVDSECIFFWYKIWGKG